MRYQSNRPVGTNISRWARAKKSCFVHRKRMFIRQRAFQNMHPQISQVAGNGPYFSPISGALRAF